MSVMTGIALSLCLGVSKRTTVRSCQRQSRRSECKTETRRFRSDSEYVARIALGLLQGERQLNNEGDADLWDEFVTGVRLTATRQLSFVWIKGHATRIHIDREITTTLDNGGNDAADALASAAAAHHAAPQAQIEAATKRHRVDLATAALLLQRRDVLCSMSEADPDSHWFFEQLTGKICIKF